MTEATETRQPALNSKTRPHLIDRPLILVALHLVLALVIRANTGAATVYFYATVLVCFYYSLRTTAVAPKLYSMAYIAGAEVVWRMMSVLPLWEIAKYLVVVFGALAFISRGAISRRSWIGIAFILLLLPSAYSTINLLGFSLELRKALSFNLSGPLVLAVSVAAFGAVSSQELAWRRLLHCVVAPSATISGLALLNIRATEAITFTGEANFVTSGGYGPNQVATVLGLASVGTLLLAIRQRGTPNLWLLAVATWFFVQAAATFSRGGTLAAIMTVAVLLAHLATAQRMRLGIIVLTVLVAVSVPFIMDKVDNWTGGKLEQRFRDLDSSGRDRIARHEFELFKQFPIFGVGPGVASLSRREEGRVEASHTELSRILAEHGSLGIVAILTVSFAGLLVYFHAPGSTHRGWVATFLFWGLLTMGHLAMRISLPGFIFGLAFLNWTSRPIRR